MRLLRRDDAADGVTAREQDSAMINFGFALISFGRKRGALDQSASARRAPVGSGLIGENSVTLGADAFHTPQASGFARRQAMRRKA